MSKYLKKVQELRQERKTAATEMKQMNDTAEKENRDFNEQEETRWSELEQKVNSLDQKIERNLTLEREEQEQRREAEEAEKRGEGEYRGGKESNAQKRAKDIANFSFAKAIRQHSQNKLDGIEKEMHEEGMNQNRGAGEGLQIPAMVLTKTELRAATATGVTGETDAGDFVPTDHMGFIDNLINRMVVFEMGADIMTGLSGNVDIPKKTSDQTATWEGEIDETPESEIGVGKVSLSPKRLSSLGKFSRQLLIQSNPNVERIVRESLTRAIMQKLQATIINGATGGDNFVGILNDSGITNSVPLEGGNPSFSDMVALETAVAADNADLGALAYLTNAKVRGYLKTKALDSGSGRFVWENNEINGYRGFVTNSVPSDLTYGSGTSEISDLSAIIFGNWADLIIGQFGGMNIITDPFTSKKNAMIELQADSFWDIGIKHDESFAVISDAKTS